MAVETVCWVLVFWDVGTVGRVIGDAGQITPPPPAEVVPAKVIVLPGLGRERRSTDAAIRSDCIKTVGGTAAIPPPVPPSLLRRNPPADAERRVEVVVDVAAGSPRSLRITLTSSPARSFRFSAPELELEAGADGCRLLLAAAIEGKTSEDLHDDDDDVDDEWPLDCESQAVLLLMGGAFSND